MTERQAAREEKAQIWFATLENANGHSDPIFETNPVTTSSVNSDCVSNTVFKFKFYFHG